jgi:hypothetical protein
MTAKSSRRSKKRTTTIEEAAAMAIEPIAEFRSDEGRARFQETLDHFCFLARSSFAILSRTKAELVKSNIGMGADTTCHLYDDLTEAVDQAKALSEMLNSARLRLLCAAAASVAP